MECRNGRYEDGNIILGSVKTFNFLTSWGAFTFSKLHLIP
jgi:hypothetical protein